MSVCARLVVTGLVWGIGYRAYVKQAAYRLKIKGTVRNTEDGDVEIYCRACNADTLERFKEMLGSGVGEIDGIEEYLEGTEGYGQGPEKWIGFRILFDEYDEPAEMFEYILLAQTQVLNQFRGSRIRKGNEVGICREHLTEEGSSSEKE